MKLYSQPISETTVETQDKSLENCDVSDSSELDEHFFSRVEVITEKGREYVSWSNHKATIQDNGRTLKIFKESHSFGAATGDEQRNNSPAATESVANYTPVQQPRPQEFDDNLLASSSDLVTGGSRSGANGQSKGGSSKQDSAASENTGDSNGGSQQTSIPYVYFGCMKCLYLHLQCKECFCLCHINNNQFIIEISLSQPPDHLDKGAADTARGKQSVCDAGELKTDVEVPSLRVGSTLKHAPRKRECKDLFCNSFDGELCKPYGCACSCHKTTKEGGEE